jgi:3-hydroxy-9,10-secoandrosta-1,3,5(10)-triene-9,17-dione monooxygenase
MSAIHQETTASTRAELVERAESLRPILERNAVEAETTRRIPQENLDALREAGLLKITVPRRYGGFEVPLSTKLAVSEAVARNTCGSTAWVTALINVCNWMGGLLPARGQDDIWGENPEAAIAGVLNPSSDVKNVPGGYEVSGRWPWASGSLHANWVLVGIEVPDEAGNVVDQALAFAPIEDVTIEDTWYVAGMKGTGSNTIVADSIFIPEHRTFSVPRAIENLYATPYTDEIAYRQSFIPTLTLILGGPQIGLGQAALDFVLSKAGKRGIAYTKFEHQSDSTAFQLEIAKAAMLLDTGRLHMYRAASDIERAALAGDPLDYLSRARARGDTGYGIKRIREAIDVLMSAHGASAFADISPLQRIWRDSNTAGRHAVIDPAVNEEVYGKALVGVPYEDNITPLI